MRKGDTARVTGEETPSIAARANSAWRGAVRVVPLLALWLLPVVAATVSIPLTFALDDASVTSPVDETVTVGSRNVDHATAVNVTVTFGAAPSIRTRAAGVLTAIATPMEMDNGSELFAIDGVPVRAYMGPVLFRDLRLGDSGSDVRGVGTFLGASGFGAPDSDRFDEAFESAVREYQRSIGVDVDGVFRLAYAAYIPEGVTTVASVEASLGDQLQPGDTVLVGNASAESLTLTAIAEGVVLNAPAGQMVLRAADVELPVPGVKLDGEAASSLVSALDTLVSEGQVRMTRIDDQRTQYGGTVLALAVPELAGVVPSTAVYVDANGGSCLFSAARPDAAPDASPVPLANPTAGTELGTVAVESDLIGTEIFRAPHEAVGEDALCE